MTLYIIWVMFVILTMIWILREEPIKKGQVYETQYKFFYIKDIERYNGYYFVSCIVYNNNNELVHEYYYSKELVSRFFYKRGQYVVTFEYKDLIVSHYTTEEFIKFCKAYHEAY